MANGEVNMELLEMASEEVEKAKPAHQKCELPEAQVRFNKTMVACVKPFIETRDMVQDLHDKTKVKLPVPWSRNPLQIESRDAAVVYRVVLLVAMATVAILGYNRYAKDREEERSARREQFKEMMRMVHGNQEVRNDNKLEPRSQP